MKTITFTLVVTLLGLMASSCDLISGKSGKEKVKHEIDFKDHGPDPAVLDVRAYTRTNTDFRRTLWTGPRLQVTLMAIPPDGEIGLERHADTDQFLRVERGVGEVEIGSHPDSLTLATVRNGFAIFVPAGKWHNLRNTGDKPLKIYSIYTPAEHPRGTVHKTAAESVAAHH